MHTTWDGCGRFGLDPTPLIFFLEGVVVMLQQLAGVSHPYSASGAVVATLTSRLAGVGPSPFEALLPPHHSSQTAPVARG